MPAAEFEQRWPAVPDCVPAARHEVRHWLQQAGTPDPPLSDICLAVSEATTNVVVHAYRGQEPGPMDVRLAIRDEEIEVIVQDEGSGMVPRPDSPGLGLGMPLIATVSERFDVHAPRDGGTRICIWFKRDPAGLTAGA